MNQVSKSATARVTGGHDHTQFTQCRQSNLELQACQPSRYTEQYRPQLVCGSFSNQVYSGFGGDCFLFGSKRMIAFGQLPWLGGILRYQTSGGIGWLLVVEDGSRS